ncbi:MAG: LLM class flavin-dependent oxidoreductase, partial [Candidatus Nitrosocosmicus sp.]
MKKESIKIPYDIASSEFVVGSPYDVIEMLERFIKSGTNHFIIRFWGDGLYKNIETFGNKVVPYFRDLEK